MTDLPPSSAPALSQDERRKQIKRKAAKKGGDRFASAEEAMKLIGARAKHAVTVDQPMLLIAQPTRSGGSLLSQLFDGHPQLHAHPYELEFGHPDKNTWPQLDLRDTPSNWFAQLSEPHAVRGLRKGYSKDRPARKLQMDDQLEEFPFLMVPSFQRKLFIRLVRERVPTTRREVIECYFTSYFNAWMDNQNLYGPDKRWVVAFRSGLGTPENVAAFFDDYPDGRHLASVREAKGWIASRHRMWGDLTPERTVKDYISLWNRYTMQRLDIRAERGDAAYLCTFERLVTDTEPLMRSVSAWLGIDYDPLLALPTFNRTPIKANSSFKVESHGVISQPLENWRTVLSEDEARLIDRRCGETYAAARELAESDLARYAAAADA